MNDYSYSPRNEHTRRNELARADVLHALIDSALPGMIAFVVILAFQGPKMAASQGMVIFTATFATKLLYLKYVVPGRTRNLQPYGRRHSTHTANNYPRTASAHPSRRAQPLGQYSPASHYDNQPPLTPGYAAFPSALPRSTGNSQYWTRAVDGVGYVPIGPDGRPQYELRKPNLPPSATLM